jgi:hypothetical protein
MTRSATSDACQGRQQDSVAEVAGGVEHGGHRRGGPDDRELVVGAGPQPTRAPANTAFSSAGNQLVAALSSDRTPPAVGRSSKPTFSTVAPTSTDPSCCGTT